MKRWPLSVAALGTGVVVLAGPALAYFSVDGTGNAGYAHAGALGTPTVSAARLLGFVTFRVAHTPSGVPPQGYDVNTGNEHDVCTIHGTTGTCTDGIYLGKQTFHVRSFVGQWVGPLVTCTFGAGDLVAACGGSAGSSGGIGISLDVSTPVLSVSDDLGISSSDGITNKTKVNLVGTGPIGATVVILDAGVEIAHGLVDAAGHYSIAVTLAEGSHSVTAYARTTADIGPVSAAGVIKIDLTAPLLSVKLDTTAVGFRVTGTAGVLTDDLASVHLAADNGSSVPSTEPLASGKFAADVQAATGTTLVTVSQTDVAGNTTLRSVTIVQAKSDPAPASSSSSSTNPLPSSDPSPTTSGTPSGVQGEPKSDPGTTKSDPSAGSPTSTPPAASADDKPAPPAPASSGTSGSGTPTASSDPSPAGDAPSGATPTP
jgi:hypothetical protein